MAVHRMADSEVRSPTTPVRGIEWFVLLCLSVGLTFVFFQELWLGGGVIGGDIYPYFFPQKQFYAESLQAGELPLWNNRSGFGYPVVAESQTGVFYPPHLLLYRLFDVNRAYCLNQLAHYVLAFVFTWLLARDLRLMPAGAALASSIYVYGWFPPRLCLEWAIIGGAWVPFAVWCMEKYLKTGCLRSAAGVSFTVGLQLLAGHYNLAFITVLLLALWIPARLWFWSEEVVAGLLRRRYRTAAVALLAIGLGFGLGAVQVLPTWELKQLSQREDIDGPEFDPGYGHIPPLYLSQTVASWWFWYDPEINRDQAVQQLSLLSIDSATNQTEAHLYFGLPAVLLLIYVLIRPEYRQAMWSRRSAVLAVLALLATVYAVGWLLPVLKHVPGFAFFRGPGRYGIVTTLCVAMLAGMAVDAVLARRRLSVLVVGIIGATVFDLYYVANVVSVAVQLKDAPTTQLEQSPIKKLFEQHSAPVRVFGPGPNMLNLLGVAAVPEYLGIGPAEYYDPQLIAPPMERIDEFLTWAERAGVTHLLVFEPVNGAPSDRMQLVFSGVDQFLHPAWARQWNEPILVYELIHTRGRAAFVDIDTGGRGNGHITSIVETANQVVVEVDASEPARLVVTDLYWPGWSVAIDGKPEEPIRIEGQFRGVDVPAGRHRVVWSFRSVSIKWGSAISVATLVLLAGVCIWITWRRPHCSASCAV